VLGVKAFMMVRQTEQKQNVFSVKKKKHQWTTYAYWHTLQSKLTPLSFELFSSMKNICLWLSGKPESGVVWASLNRDVASFSLSWKSTGLSLITGGYNKITYSTLISNKYRKM
jgi:hypothetical protein